MYQINLTS